MLYHLFELEIHVVFCRVCFNIQQVESTLTNLLYEVALIANQMVRTEPVTRSTFCVTIILIEPCSHVDAAVEMPTISFFKWFYSTTADAAEVTTRHHVSKSNVERKIFVELFDEVGLTSWLSCGLLGFVCYVFFLSLDIVLHDGTFESIKNVSELFSV